MTVNRRTIKSDCAFSGRGLHSGEPVQVRLLPGSEGIQFRCGSETVDALPANVTDTSRCTVLGSIRTVEHLMSAFAATGITDALVELSYPELPGLDGSARDYWLAISESGFEDLGTRDLNDIYTRLYVQADDVKIAVGKGTGHWRFDFVTDGRWPSEQTFDCPEVLSRYGSDIAPARTTVFADEIERAQAAGLGRGLDEFSVVVIGQSGYESPVRFDDEPARHKLLDLIGDLYLSGVPIDHLNVVGYRSGHRRNVEMAKLLFEAAKMP